jgi:3-oxoacyl-[acyl-carrier-protein] synthase-3
LQTCRFESLGTYTPSKLVSSAELVSRIRAQRSPDIGAITGIRNRRVYDSDPDRYESSFVLARKAIDDCLARSDYRADQIDVVISTSITRTVGPGEFSFDPPFALMLRNDIGARDAIAFDLSNACAGLTTGVLVLNRMIRSGAVSNGLVVSGEQITPITETAIHEIDQPYDPQFASLTVGDAAAAVVVDGKGDADDAIHFVELMTTAAGAGFCLGMPSDRSGGMAMYTDNRSMQNQHRYNASVVSLADYLAEAGATLQSEGFDFMIHHQFSGPAIAQMVRLGQERFGRMPEVLNVLEDFGNTASTSHYLVLHEHLRTGRIPKGSKVLLLPTASGMVYGHLSATITRLAQRV